MKNYGVKNQLYARYQKNMLESLIYKECVYSGVRYISGIDPFQGIHIVIELGYLGANFILASGKICLCAQSLRLSVLFLIHLFLSGVCPPLNICFELGAMQTLRVQLANQCPFSLGSQRAEGINSHPELIGLPHFVLYYFIVFLTN